MPPAPTTPTDSAYRTRRHSGRKPAPRDRRIVLFPAGAGGRQRLEAVLRDYCARGIGFDSPRALPPGEQLVLRLVSRDGRLMPVGYRVVHCTPTTPGVFRVGARFCGLAQALERPEPTPGLDSNAPADAPALPHSLNAPADAPALPHSLNAPRPATPAPPRTAPSGGFDANTARGFDRQFELAGQTVSGWQRTLDLRRSGERVWINMHPPGKTSGWGMYISLDELCRALDQLQSGGGNRVINA